MKHLYIVLSFLFTIPLSSNASHLKGGEITWKCLSNGQYQFYMNIYRECAGASFNYVDQIIDVSATGVSTTQITVKPDSSRFLAMNNGNFNPTNTNGDQVSCATNPQKGITQVFPFVSDPINLSGIPPASGIVFSFTICCKAPADNLANPTSETFFIRSIMYPYENKTTNSCYDNSVSFVDFPNMYSFYANKYSFSNAAYDMDLDSLVFAFDTILTSISTSSIIKPEYSFKSPFPGTNLNPQNIPPHLKSNSGHINGKIQSGMTGDEFAYSFRVDSYRKGIKISSVWREISLISYNKPSLNTGAKNNAPKIEMNNQLTDTLQISVDVGDKISIPIRVSDNDLVFDDPNDSSSTRLQDVRLSAMGLFFSNDFADTSNCALSTLSLCATLSPAPVPHPTTNEFGLIGRGEVNTLFEWQPSCDLFQPWEKQKFFNFVFGAVDDYISSNNRPGPVDMNFSTLTIEVNRKTTEIIHIGNTLTVLDTGHTYNWYRNDTLIPAPNSNSITINKTGMYSVVVDYSASCFYPKAYYNVQGCYGIIDSLSACDSIVWRDGNIYSENTNEPTFILPNPNGCDTVVKLNFKLKKTTGIDSIISCGSFTWIDGLTYTHSTNTPQFVIPNSAGCDSIITLKLSIPEFTLTIDRTINTLISNQLNASYQWLDCENTYAEITGETNRNFSPSENGVYACEITKDGCKDTTQCKSFYFIGLEEHFAESINIYPNPSNDIFNIELLGEMNGDIELKMMDINGRELQIKSVRSNKRISIGAQNLAKGIYFLNVRSNDGQANFKLLKL